MSLLRKNPDGFLRKVSGVIHVGANSGQERDLYKKYGLSVLWIEPIPEVFEKLEENIKGYSGHQAIQALVADVDGKDYEFNVANNKGASSSILEFHQHKDIWPDVTFERTIQLKSLTLPTLLEKNKVKLNSYNALVLDTQGSELVILKGAEAILHNFKFVKTEVPDFESYKGCCQLSDMGEFMIEKGFEEYSSSKFANRSEGGSYYDIVYKRRE